MVVRVADRDFGAQCGLENFDHRRSSSYRRYEFSKFWINVILERFGYLVTGNSCLQLQGDVDRSFECYFHCQKFLKWLRFVFERLIRVLNQVTDAGARDLLRDKETHE